MKGRTTILLAAAAILASATAHASGIGAPDRLPAPDPTPRDTTVHAATKSLIESFGELSKTASKLSETAIKLMEAQELLDEKQREAERPVTKKRQTGRRTEHNGPNKANKANAYSNATPTEPEDTDFDNGVYIEPDEYETPAGGNGVYLGDDKSYRNDHGNGTMQPEAENEEQHSDAGNGELRSLWDLPQEDSGKGRYIWIPEDKTYIVESVLEGSVPRGAYKRGEPDLNELTYWRGDSIPMAIPTKRLGRYDRKLYNWLIYPKGLWHIGLTANYGELSTQDSEFLSLIDDVDLGGTIYSIKPSVSYFFRNNLCMGLRLAYTKGKMGVDSFKVDIDEDMSFNLHDINYLSESYSAALFLQQYFGLSRRGRFAVYNEVELAVSSGNNHFSRPFDGEIRETRTKTKSLNINYSPGLSVMVMKNAAINLSFGVFGFHVRKDKQWENGDESGDQLTSGINFRFNIFNINFGVCVII